MKQELIVTSPHDLEATEHSFGQWQDMVAATVAASSARIYYTAFKRWEVYCELMGLNPIADLTFQHVNTFINGLPIALAGRRTYLSALKKLAGIVAALKPEFQSQYHMLTMLKAQRNEDSTPRERPTLTPSEADRCLRVWNSGSLRDIRNHAIVATLLLSGLRRQELVELRWSDIDLQRGIIAVRHGKGDKAREVALYGKDGLKALLALREVFPDNQHVFISINKGDKPGNDKPISPEAVYAVLKQTAERAGLPHLSPHSFRRTLATELLATGGNLKDVQEQLGHSDGSTTLKYAQAVNAENRRKGAKLRYGG